MNQSQKEKRKLEDYGKEVKTLGNGSYGRVYLTDGGNYGKPVAIKKARRYDMGSGFTEPTILTEIVLLTKLDHPYIPKIIDFHFDDQYFYLVQESPGRSPYVGENRLSGYSKDQVPQIISCLAQVYQYLERQGILHCDLKPGNILITSNSNSVEGSQTMRFDRVESSHLITSNFVGGYLIDFGLAILLGPADQEAGPVDLSYVEDFRAPEILLGSTFFDYKAEAWALGVLWLSLLEGEYIKLNNYKYDPVNGSSNFKSMSGISMIGAWQEYLGSIRKAWPEARYLPYGPHLLTLEEPLEIPKLERLAYPPLMKSLLSWRPGDRPSMEQISQEKVVPLLSSREYLRQRSKIIKKPLNIAITSEVRGKVLLWLLDLKSKFCLMDRVYFLAIQYFDLFLNGISIGKEDLKSYALVSLHLATCLLNPVIDYIDLIKPETNINDFHKREQLMLETLSFDLFQATSFDFLALSLPQRDFEEMVMRLRILVRTFNVYSLSLEEMADVAQNLTPSMKIYLASERRDYDQYPVDLGREKCNKRLKKIREETVK